MVLVVNRMTAKNKFDPTSILRTSAQNLVVAKLVLAVKTKGGCYIGQGHMQSPWKGTD